MWGTFLLTKWCRFRISKPFSNRSKFEIFCNMPLPNLLFNVNYLGHLEDSGNDVGDFFAHKVMQIPNLETVFESEANLKFFVTCHSLTYFLTSITSVTLRNQKFLSIQFWSLSDLDSENRVRFARSIKKYFHFCSKSVEKWHLLSLFWKFFFTKNFFLRIV